MVDEFYPDNATASISKDDRHASVTGIQAKLERRVQRVRGEAKGPPS